MRLGSSLAAASAFALVQSCCAPESQETREVTTEPAAQSAPATPPEHLCEIVRQSVGQRALRGLAAAGETPGVYASFNANQAARDCYEEERMRADCRQVPDNIKRVMGAVSQSDLGCSTPGIVLAATYAGQNAEESCLAGYGLAPEEEETFASR